MEQTESFKPKLDRFVEKIVPLTANGVTYFRIILSLPLTYCLVFSHFLTAFAIFIFSGLLDGADGIIARKRDQITYMGTILDPIGDKLLIIISLIILGRNCEPAVYQCQIVILMIGESIMAIFRVEIEKGRLSFIDNYFETKKASNWFGKRKMNAEIVGVSWLILLKAEIPIFSSTLGAIIVNFLVSVSIILCALDIFTHIQFKPKSSL